MADDNDKLRVKLHVYNRELPMTIPRHEEEFYRKSGKRITDTINRYADHYKGRLELTDLLYRALIDIALRCVKEEARNDCAPIVDTLSKLTAEIEEALVQKA